MIIVAVMIRKPKSSNHISLTYQSYLNTMPNFYYTDAYGQKQGVISPSQLKELIAQGIITPDTLLETDNGHKGYARQIKGLFPTPQAPSAFTDPVAVPMPSNVPMVDTEDDSYDYRRIAVAQRLFWQSFWALCICPIVFTLLILLMILLMIPWIPPNVDNVSIISFLTFFGTSFCIGVFNLICSFRLIRALGYGNNIILAACIILFGIVIPMIYLSTIATRRLREGGYDVGFIGADMRQFGEDNFKLSKEEAIGVVIGLVMALMALPFIAMFVRNI